MCDSKRSEYVCDDPAELRAHLKDRDRTIVQQALVIESQEAKIKTLSESPAHPVCKECETYRAVAWAMVFGVLAILVVFCWTLFRK